jgi:hypothetical protein
MNLPGPAVHVQKKNGLLGGKKRGGRSGRAHREDSIKRTVYVSDIDQSVSLMLLVRSQRA